MLTIVGDGAYWEKLAPAAFVDRSMISTLVNDGHVQLCTARHTGHICVMWHTDITLHRTH